MSELNLTLVTVGGLVLFLGLVSDFLKKHTFITEPMLALLAGILFGPSVLGWLNPAEWNDQNRILEEVARVTLAIGLMAVALRLPTRYPLNHWRSQAGLIGLIMPLMWLSTAGCVWFILDTPFWLALLIAAVLTPTDPIVATSIVTGDLARNNLPNRIRNTLSAETGFNDGLAYPIVVLGILLVPGQSGSDLWGGLMYVLFWEIGGAVLCGTIAGYLGGQLLHWSERRRTIEKTSFLAYTLALSLFTLGAAKLIHTESILAVFIAGLAFDLVVGGRERAEEAGFQEAVSQFFTLPVFTLFGLMLPWSAWLELGWAGLLLPAAILAFRRLPFLLLVTPILRPLHGSADALYIGWFGPMGVAALHYSMVILSRTGYEEPWTLGSLVVFASILAHGLTATPVTKWYGKTGRLRQ